MDFFYENAGILDDTNCEVEKGSKTDQIFQQLEAQIDQHYQHTTNAFKKIIRDPGAIELKFPNNDELTKTAQDTFKKIDENIQNIEQIAQSCWNKVSSKSLWSAMTNNISNQFSQISTPQKNESKDVSAYNNAMVNNNTEYKLNQLNTDKNLYLNSIESSSNLDIDSYDAVISRLLNENPDLNNLMNLLVPEKISYQNFWSTYFNNRKKVLGDEPEIMHALRTKVVASDEYVGIDWDYDGDDDELDLAVMKKNDSVKEIDTDINDDHDWE